MGEIQLRKKSFSTKFVVKILYVMAIFTSSCAFPTIQDEEADREYQPVGAHQLASYLLSQLRRNVHSNQPEFPILPYRISHTGKRNSAELTSSIMGIPRNMIDNGKK